MKKSTRIFALLLCILTAFSIIPMSVTAAETDFKIITAIDHFYLNGAYSTLTSSLEEDAEMGEYVHLVASPGDYDNNGLVVATSLLDFAITDYPYIVYGYRTNSQKSTVDVGSVSPTKGENWMNANPTQVTNGKWSTMIVNSADINGNASANPTPEGELGITFRLKPWGSHGKTLQTEQYFDLAYVAAFKTLADAEAFKYDPNHDYGPVINPGEIDNIPFYAATDADIEKYMSEALALRDKIIASETDIEYTGTAYYISHKGDDSNDGLTPQSAWQSPTKVSKASFLKAGDAVLFERGGTYRYTGTLGAVEGVTYSAFGTGAKPKLIGSIDASLPSDWELTEVENVYKYTGKLGGAAADVGQIIFDLGRAWGIKLQNGLAIGTNSNGLEMIASGTPKIGGPEGLKHDLEYFHKWNEGDNLYLYSKDGNPAERFSSIEIVDRGNGIAIGGKNITIDNLELFGFGSHGVGSGTTEGLTVQNCTFSFIGGSRQFGDWNDNTRFGNAVEIYGGAKNFIIRNCYAHNIYDCCWTVQYQSDSQGRDIIFEDVEFYNNVACYSNTGLEVWLNNKAEYNNTDATYGMKNLRLHDNYTFYNGYGWSQQRPNKDGNIFYGDPSVTTTVYENCSVYRNVGMFASKWVNFVRYVGPNGYNFNNNIYFQNSDKLFGGVPANPGKGTGPVGEYKYDAKTMSRLLATGFEEGSTFYYSNGYEIPEYEPEIMTFKDITKEHWAYKNIEAAVMRGYFNGISQLEFAPESSMTRAMLVTVLSRLLDTTVKTSISPYTDVNQNAWYASAVNRAYSLGIIDRDATTFRPDEAATREEMADMMYRFTKNTYKCGSYDEKSLAFKDAASVSDKYRAGVAFATENGIITGYPDGTVKPNGTATRAEVATMMKRFAAFYGAQDVDFNKISTKTDFHVFSGEELSSKMSTDGGDKKIDANSGMLTLIPANPALSSANPRMTIHERFLKFKLADYPYVKVRFKSTGAADKFAVGVNRNGDENWIISDAVANEWNEAVVCVYDIIAPGGTYMGDELTGKLILCPWEVYKPMYNQDISYIDYIGFFPTKAAAEAYNG